MTARRNALLVVSALLFALLGSVLAVPAHSPAVAAPGESNPPAPNPDLRRACGIDIHMILDESGSVRNFKSDVQTAFRAFTGALRNTGSRLAVSEFSTVARLPLSGGPQNTYTPVTDATIANTFEPYIAADYNPNGSTNWEDAFRVARYQLARPNASQPHLVVFITDGDPNRVIRESRVTQDEYENKVPLNNNEVQNASDSVSTFRAVQNANGVKNQGSHILALAVGNGLNNQDSLDRLIDVSGPDVYSGAPGTNFDIETTDVYREADFSQLEQALREAAFQLCAPSVTVQKLVDLTPDDDVSDAVPGSDLELTAVASPTPSNWVIPQGATGDTAVNRTDVNGFANFQWELPTPQDSSVTITEADPSTGPIPSLEFRPDLTTCSVRTLDQPIDQPLATTPVTLGFTAQLPQDAIVTCTIYNVVPPSASVTIEKATNGNDADAAPGPTIPISDPVTWTYEVTNTGNVTLSTVEVTDSIAGVSPVCPVTSLAPGASTTCTATGVATSGQYMNTGTVTANDPDNDQVTANDPSHYFGADPSITIEKSTNGVDADAAPGPIVGVGDAVDWEYVVTNVGNEDLTNLSVTDSEGVTVDCGGVTTLPVAALTTCTASGTAVTGQYTNIGTATADGAASTVTATDPSHYFGAAPAIELTKYTNFLDVPSAPGPTLEVGADVIWIYEVTNTGNTPIIGYTVTDDVAGVNPFCQPSVNLPVGATHYCVATGIAIEGQYVNNAEVTAPNPIPGGPGLSATDTSWYFGALPGISIEKTTNGVDADVPTGPFIDAGATVTWEYTVTNTGNVDLDDIVVTDAPEGTITGCPTSLVPGASGSCTATSTAVIGQYANNATVVASDPNDVEVTDSDPSHYFGANPGIDVEKSTNGVDADTVLTAPFILEGDPVTWTYSIVNTGNENLTGITIADDQIDDAMIDCGAWDNTLTPGESATCTATGVATDGVYANLASVQGTPTVGPDVTDTDPSHYAGYEPGVSIEKATNGVDADLPPGPFITVGDPVTWTYVVTNTGDVPITSFDVVDSDPALVVNCPADRSLAPGASATCTATGVAIAGQYSNIGTVNAEDRFEDPLTDGDPSHYFGAEPAITIEKATNGVDADLAPGPILENGSLVTWTYLVTNAGNVALTDVAVADDIQGAASCPATVLAPGATMTCQLTGLATTGQYSNLGTVTATDPAGTAVRATDPSHYSGVAVLPPVTTSPPVITPPPTGGLPETGSSGIETVIKIGVLSALLGGLLLLARRRRTPSVTNR